MNTLIRKSLNLIFSASVVSHAATGILFDNILIHYTISPYIILIKYHIRTSLFVEYNLRVISVFEEISEQSKTCAHMSAQTQTNTSILYNIY